MNTETDTKTAKFTLWFRRDKWQHWKAVATAETSQELTNRIGQLGRNGDWLTLPSGEHPDDDRRGKR